MTITPIPRADRPNAIRELVNAGYNDPRIAAKLGVCPATVQRTRKAHGIPSGHNPARTRTQVHGTAGMWRRCACGTCKDARNKTHADYVAQLSASSAKTAHRAREPWTPDEDRVVMDRSIPVSIIARRLGRTWSAVTQRRRRLRDLATA